MWIETGGKLINLRKIVIISKTMRFTIGFIQNGEMREIEYDTTEDRDLEYERIKNILLDKQGLT